MIDIDAFEEFDELPTYLNIKKPVQRKNKVPVGVSKLPPPEFWLKSRRVDQTISHIPIRLPGLKGNG